MLASRSIYVPLSAVAAASPLPTPSSGLPLLSGLVLTAGSFETTFIKQQINFTLIQPYRTLIQQYQTLIQQYRTLIQLFQTLIQLYRTLIQQYRTLIQQYRTLIQLYRTLIQLYRTLPKFKTLVKFVYLLAKSPFEATCRQSIAPIAAAARCLVSEMGSSGYSG